MKYRDHRRGLKESMETMREIEPTIDALAVILKVPPSTVTVEPYGYDHRIGWDTYLVAVEGRAVGFCNAFVEPYKNPRSDTGAEHEC
jgi:hypothetical protein